MATEGSIIATKGAIDLFINALPDQIRVPLKNAFYYTLDNLRIGDGPRAENLQWYKVSSTTAATANTEFPIAHGMGITPHLLIPVLDLTKIGAQTIALMVSRAPDQTYVYLKSASTSAVFTIYLE